MDKARIICLLRIKITFVEAMRSFQGSLSRNQ